MIASDLQSRRCSGWKKSERLCPEMRLGQVLATVAMLGEDSQGDPSGTSRTTICRRPSRGWLADLSRRTDT